MVCQGRVARGDVFPGLFLMNVKEFAVHHPLKLSVAAAVAVFLAGCAGFMPGKPVAQANLEGRSGSQVKGVVTFHRAGDATIVRAEVAGLTPGEHGFHVHEAGDCSAPDAASAKGHFNPHGMKHGYHHHHHAERHVGDLPNLVADAQGRAVYKAEVKGLSLSAGAEGIVGRSVVVHADPDDYHSQPAGNSGKRVACGVIQVP